MLFRGSALRSAAAARFAFSQPSSKTARIQAGSSWYAYVKQSAERDVSHISTPVKALDGENFLKFKLRKTEDVTHNTRLFRFDLPSPQHILGLNVASAIVARFAKPGTESQEKPEYVIRPYTPTSDEDAKGYFDLVIKRYPDGPMSTYIHSLKPGDELEVKGPIPKYPYEKGKLANVGMIAGGTGITPMLQLLRKVFEDPTDQTKVSLIFANVTEDDIILRKNLDKLQSDHPGQFQVHYTLDKPPKGWTGEKGFVSANMIQRYLPSSSEERVMIFVCGPPGMVAQVSGPKVKATQGDVGGILGKLGYTKETVYKF